MIMNFIADLDFLVDIIIFGIFKDILIHSFLSKLECISHFIQFSAYVLSYMRHDIEGVCVLGDLRRRRSLRSVWPSSERLYWSILLWHVANVLSTSSLLKTYLLKKNIFKHVLQLCNTKVPEITGVYSNYIKTEQTYQRTTTVFYTVVFYVVTQYIHGC